MTDTTGEERRIVSCDGCGNPYAAMMERDELRLVGPEEPGCPTCGGLEFTPISI